MEVVAEKNIKNCKNCGEPVVRKGRSDIQYCSDECKSDYKNKVDKEAAAKVPFIKDINQILMSNWVILKDCLGDQTTCAMRVRDLNGRKFNFKFFTSERLNDHNDDIYFFCYDYGYKYVDDDEKVIIVQSDHEVKLTGKASRF